MNSVRQVIEDVINRIASADEAVFAQSHPRDTLVTCGIQALITLDRDIEKVRQEAGILFSAALKELHPEMTGHKLAQLFTLWRKEPPCMVALITVAAETLGIDFESPAFRTALMAGLAADVRNDNPYHGNGHFREVTCMMIRYLVTHDELAAANIDNAQTLNSTDMAKCIAAAAAHDLLHDGKGNSPDGIHTQYRLEAKAIAAFEPLMQLAGLASPDREEIRVMIRITDVTSRKGGISPHNILRASAHGEAAEVPPELSLLKNNTRLLTMAAMMSDSDLGPSAATNYIFGASQTKLLSAENPAIKAGSPLESAQSMKGFLEFIVAREFISPAGKFSERALCDIYGKVAGRLAHPEAQDLDSVIKVLRKHKGLPPRKA